jgi:hypothetical protein
VLFHFFHEGYKSFGYSLVLVERKELDLVGYGTYSGNDYVVGTANLIVDSFACVTNDRDFNSFAGNRCQVNLAVNAMLGIYYFKHVSQRFEIITTNAGRAICPIFNSPREVRLRNFRLGFGFGFLGNLNWNL